MIDYHHNKFTAAAGIFLDDCSHVYTSTVSESISVSVSSEYRVLRLDPKQPLQPNVMILVAGERT